VLAQISARWYMPLASLRVLLISRWDQIADILTKPLERTKFIELRQKIGIQKMVDWQQV
jgi:hypothetical protein